MSAADGVFVGLGLEWVGGHGVNFCLFALWLKFLFHWLVGHCFSSHWAETWMGRSIHDDFGKKIIGGVEFVLVFLGLCGMVHVRTDV